VSRTRIETFFLRGPLGALGLALILACLLRIWGLDYGIPHPTIRPDEERLAGRAQTIFATGDWHPGSFFYPSLPFYADALALHVYYGAGKLMGRYEEPRDFLFDIAVTRPGLHYRISRAVSAAAGVATVLAAYALSLAAYRRTGPALLAALSLAVCHVHVRDSHFATVDVIATLFVTLSLVFTSRALERPTARNFALAGVLAGLATSSKYNAGLVVIPIGVAALYRGRHAVSRLPLAAAAAAGAFALTSPYVLLRLDGFQSNMSFLEDYLYRSGDLAIWDHLKLTFPHGLGWPLYVASALGLARALLRRCASDVTLLSFAVPFLVLISSVRVTFPRYVLPLVPLLMVLAADFVASLLDRIPSPRARSLSSAVAALVLLAPPLLDSSAFARIAAREDTRLQAASFISKNFQPRTRILVCRGYGAPAINDDRRRPPSFVVEELDCLAETPLPGGADFLVTHEHRELSFSRIHPSLLRFLEEQGQTIATFDPYRPQEQGSGVEPVFHRSDAFYIPFAGLSAVDRGGPIVRIWKLHPLR
jgi:4-amino-4-deoxy-L-arabinose transferase-like glycosyltransferase